MAPKEGAIAGLIHFEEYRAIAMLSVTQDKKNGRRSKTGIHQSRCQY
jgi:hypothetical protein